MLVYLWKLSPSEHLQAPVEVGLPWRSGSPVTKVVKPLLQLYWAMYLHAFGTGGSIDSLATRCPLSNQNMLMGWHLRFVLVALSPDQVLILGSCNMQVIQYCWITSHWLHLSLSSSQPGTTYRRTLLHFEPWTFWGLLQASSRCWSSLCTWRTWVMSFSWCGQKTMRWCHNRFRGWKFLSDSMYWKVPVLLLLGHAREDSNPGSLDGESAILPLS